MYPSWVHRKSSIWKQMFSAVHPTTDIARILRHVRFVPCVDGSGSAREIFTSQAWSVSLLFGL